MADGVAITAGSGTTILTDDTGAGGHAQVVKLAISTDGSPTLIPAEATYGLDVDVTRIAALSAGTAYVGTFGINGGTATASVFALASSSAVAMSIVDSTGAALALPAPSVISATPALSTAVYSPNDAMGTALSFGTAVAASNGTGHILRVTFVDKDDLTHDGSNGAMRLDLYNASVTVTDNAAYAVASDTEAERYVGSVPSTSGTWYDIGPSKVCTVRVSPPLPYSCSGSTTLYGVLVAETAPSGSHSASGVVVKVHVARD